MFFLVLVSRVTTLIKLVIVSSCRENGDGAPKSVVGEGGRELPQQHDELRGT